MLKSIRNRSNSGANISIKKIDNELILTKKVFFTKNNKKLRILEQLKKQNFWHKEELIKPFFSVPVKYKIKKDSISMNMPFIYGYSGADILTYNSYNQARKLANSLIKLIDFFKKGRNKKNYIEKENILKKINIVEKNSDKKFSNYFNKIKKKYENLPDYIETSFCHGDLTLSNMIITNSKQNNSKYSVNKYLEIYLVDWLDSNYETFLLDLAKLKQDLFYGWSSRSSNSSQAMANSITGKFIWNLIEEKFIDNYNKEIFNFFMNLCILRILPYVKSKKDFQWIKHVLDEEE